MSVTHNLPQTAPNGQQADLTTTLIEQIREAAIQTAIEAVWLACRIDEWHRGDLSNEALLKELKRTSQDDVWVAMGQRGKFSPAYAYRLLESTARERLERGEA